MDTPNFVKSSKEQIFIRTYHTYDGIISLSKNSSYAPYCVYCENSLIVNECEILFQNSCYKSCGTYNK